MPTGRSTARTAHGSRAATVADVVAAVEARYPADTAQPWDAVGLVCGDPRAPVRRVHIAVDPVDGVVGEALAAGADLLLTHHPLFLGGTTSVAATTAKGRVVHRLVTGGCALLVAHTNADVGAPGVSDALATALGLDDVAVLDASAASEGRGLGRVGMLPTPMPAPEFVRHVAASLPATAWGVRAATPGPDTLVTRVAVCGGSGGELAARAAGLGADALVTADLKHHSTSEAVDDTGLVLVDAGHWASEWPWTAAVADLLRADLDRAGTTVSISVSRLVTDPWSLHATTFGSGTADVADPAPDSDPDLEDL